MISAAAEYEHTGVAIVATTMPYAFVARIVRRPSAIVFSFAAPLPRIVAAGGSCVFDRSIAAAIA